MEQLKEQGYPEEVIFVVQNKVDKVERQDLFKDRRKVELRCLKCAFNYTPLANHPIRKYILILWDLFHEIAGGEEPSFWVSDELGLHKNVKDIIIKSDFRRKETNARLPVGHYHCGWCKVYHRRSLSDIARAP